MQRLEWSGTVSRGESPGAYLTVKSKPCNSNNQRAKRGLGRCMSSNHFRAMPSVTISTFYLYRYDFSCRRANIIPPASFSVAVYLVSGSLNLRERNITWLNYSGVYSCNSTAQYSTPEASVMSIFLFPLSKANRNVGLAISAFLS